MSLSRRVHGRSAQQSTHGLLPSGNHCQRCAAAWLEGVACGRHEIRLAVYVRKEQPAIGSRESIVRRFLSSVGKFVFPVSRSERGEEECVSSQKSWTSCLRFPGALNPEPKPCSRAASRSSLCARFTRRSRTSAGP